jgi:4-hydroxy-tetrahydrodipicolinate synthase
MIQDLDWTGSGMSVETIVDLFEALPTFRSLKVETVDPGPKYSAVIEATGGELHVAGGWAIRTMPDALERGVHAFMPTTMDRIYVAIYDAFRQGDRDEAWGIFERLLPVLEFSNQHIDVSIRFFKMMRLAEGMFATDSCRPPVRELTPAELAEARRHIAYVADLTREVAG